MRPAGIRPLHTTGTTAPVDSQLAHNHLDRGDTGGSGRGRGHAAAAAAAAAAEGVVARLSAVADGITSAVDLLGDQAAVEVHLRRALVTADKVRADAVAELEHLRDRLDTVIDDRAAALRRRPA
ncbi:hypothetical protein [Rhodococcus sp. JS3073]|uniref:hypothetical protein n=1 Tax=Rhodococcus sp. JS3073 TaxID=3002901 RepID=UPI002285CA1E|nr:hypothetical protein [Rhodococcus sp. JS3073]WAM14587.1 hypothetical protein OYT95_35140 [Rhodococcus sp. JS3073]